jgi:hypothetical protein
MVVRRGTIMSVTAPDHIIVDVGSSAWVKPESPEYYDHPHHCAPLTSLCNRATRFTNWERGVTDFTHLYQQYHRGIPPFRQDLIAIALLVRPHRCKVRCLVMWNGSMNEDRSVPLAWYDLTLLNVECTRILLLTAEAAICKVPRLIVNLC